MPASRSNGPRRPRPPRSTGARRKGPAAAFLAGARSPGDQLGRRRGGTRWGGAAALWLRWGAPVARTGEIKTLARGPFARMSNKVSLCFLQ
jgi:hypothetical protein